MDNTPQIVCNANGGVWSEESPAQCQLGCCILGDQAAFVSLVRCKKLSSFLGLMTNYDKTITSEISCVAAVQQQDRGACVYEFEFQKTCRFTTRGECTGSSSSANGTSAQGTFYKDKLCSAEELGTICGPSSQTSCMPGKDEVYFLDTCGNPANIYDASKANDKEYWSNVKTKGESCSPNSANTENTRCGNCNYLGGSYCRTDPDGARRPVLGNAICADLNCIDEDNKPRKHGESWCISDAKRQDNAPVGSRFFRRLCMNGEVVTEPCDDLRAQECVQDSIETRFGSFSQAACRVNRWQDCLAQTDRLDCENTDRRDCYWREGVSLGNESIDAVCLPRVAPGFNFWSAPDTLTVCGAGNKACVVKFEKGLLGGEECVENCECLEPGWEEDYASVCMALGDCGPKINYQNKFGYQDGIRFKIDGTER